MKINSISLSEITFPGRLRTIPQTPRKLYVQGDLSDYTVGVTIVGTRKPTAYGRQITTSIASRLAERGAVIISGLAHGTDGVAHEAALLVGGRTIGVLASGLDKVYPSQHAQLAQRMLKSLLQSI